MGRAFRGLLGAAALASLAGVSLGQIAIGVQGSATAHVRVLVNPNVGLSAVNPTVDAGTVQTGDFSASIDFRVDANKQEVSFFAAASGLYKGNDPSSTIVPPIPLNLSAGVVMQPQNGNATGGHSNTAIFLSAPGPVVDGFPTSQTETVQYSSSQNNHFSQSVNVKVTWTQGDPELPTGEYSGVVQLTALLLPGGGGGDEGG